MGTQADAAFGGWEGDFFAAAHAHVFGKRHDVATGLEEVEMQECFARTEQVNVEEIAEAQVVAAEAGQELDAELTQVARVFQAVQRLFKNCRSRRCGGVLRCLHHRLGRGLQRRNDGGGGTTRQHQVDGREGGQGSAC